MPLDIKPSNSRDRKKLFQSILLNKTNKVSKISDFSVLSGISAGIAKVAGKAEKDIFIALAQLFPDLAFSSQLDNVASLYGISPRLGATKSTTYVRVVGDPGTQYLQNTHVFENTEGVQFVPEYDFTIGSFGFGYLKVRSVNSGKDTNVDAGTITKVNPQPQGHQYVVNEYKATGGRDIESDDDFRQRIIEGGNIFAKSTLTQITQVFQLNNPEILRVQYYGISPNGKNRLGITTVSGVLLTTQELNDLITQSSSMLSLSDSNPYGYQQHGVQLENIEYQPIDISFRVELFNNFNPDDIRRDIQISISKYLDHRYFDPINQKVEWDELLTIVKNTKGVKYVSDEYFFPKTDISIHREKLPKLRGFLMLDLNGNIIQSFTGDFSPSFYPAQPDFKYQASILRDL